MANDNDYKLYYDDSGRVVVVVLALGLSATSFFFVGNVSGRIAAALSWVQFRDGSLWIYQIAYNFLYTILKAKNYAKLIIICTK